MDGDLLSKIRASVERARELCELGKQYRERAARLVLDASVLMQRFDELEQEALLRAAWFKDRRRAMSSTRHSSIRPAHH